MFMLLYVDIFNASEKPFFNDGNYKREMRMMTCPIWFVVSMWSRDARIYVLRCKFMHNLPESPRKWQY